MDCYCTVKRKIPQFATTRWAWGHYSKYASHGRENNARSRLDVFIKRTKALFSELDKEMVVSTAGEEMGPCLSKDSDYSHGGGTALGTGVN